MDERGTIQFIRASQDYATAQMRYGWSIFGLLAFAGLTISGIYFSQAFIASIVGTISFAYWFSWFVACGISALEVSAVFLFGNKDLSDIIKESNAGEHGIVWISVLILSVFDFLTNALGLALAAEKFQKIDWSGFSWETWFIIVLGSFLMTIAEILLVWQFRSFGAARVLHKLAKKKYDEYNNTVSGTGNKQQGKSSFSNLDSNYDDMFGKTNKQNAFTQQQSRPQSFQSFDSFKRK